MACFQCNEKCPLASDRLKRCVIYGARLAAHSFSSHVGSGSKEHCFTGDDRMAWTTSSVLTARKLVKSGAVHGANTGAGAAAVAALTPAILESMKSW